MSDTPTGNTFSDMALRAVAIIGLIAILVLGAWGIIQLVVVAPTIFNGFSGTSSSQTHTNTSLQEQVVATSPSILTTDQPFVLSWSHANKNSSTNYGYAISYACADGLSLAAPIPTGAMQLVPCNTPFNFTSATSSITLIPVLRTAKQVTTTFSIVANRLSTNTVAASSTTAGVTVLPSRNTQTTPAPQTTYTKPATVKTTKASARYVSSTHTSGLYGSADLVVRIMSITPGSNRTVQFSIQNIGTNVAASGWIFTANLPVSPAYTFTSQPQQVLYPGDEVVYTLGFAAPATQPYTYGNSYQYSAPVQNCQQNYIYDGYANYPANNYNCNNGYQQYTQYPQNQYPAYYQQNYNYYTNNTLSITVDPNYVVSDSNRANNYTSSNVSY